MAHRLLVLVLAAVPLMCGCGLPPDEIRSYDAPRIESPPLDSVPEADVKVRILGAIAPTTEGALFFKVGPADAAGVAALEKDFDAWIRSVELAPGKGPVWTLPKGWNEVDPGKMNRNAFMVGEGDKAIRVTIAEAGGTLLSNINRWRGQVGLRPASQAQIKLASTPISLGGKTASRVDIRGAAVASTMTPNKGPGPIKGKVMPDNHPPVDGGSGPKPPANVVGGKSRILGVVLPQGETIWFFKIGPVPADSLDPYVKAFDDFVATIRPGADEKTAPTFEAPAAWKQGPKTQFSFGSYMLSDNIKLTVTPSAGGVPQNINRWRGQVGLAPIQSENSADLGREISLGGQKAYRVDLVGTGGNGGTMAPPK